MSNNVIPPHLNTSIVYLWQDMIVCPELPIHTMHHGRSHNNFISPNWKIQGFTVGLGDKVVLEQRVRQVNGNLVTKHSGELRSVISMRDYGYNGQFDKSAFQIKVGERAPCASYPIIHTTQFVRTADGALPLDNLQLM